jgi:hypothetical protein
MLVAPLTVDETLHVTAVSFTSFKIALNCWLPPAGTCAVEGLTESPVPTPTVKTAVFDVTNVLLVVEPGVCGVVAVIFTSPFVVVGTTAGAVYTPTSVSVVDAPMVPSVELPPAVPFTYHVIVVVVVLLDELERVTCAVNSVVVLIATVTVVGEITTFVTCTVPPPPPHADIPAKEAIVNAQTAQRGAIFRIIGLPFDRSAPDCQPNHSFGGAFERSPEKPIYNPREPSAHSDVWSFPSVCSLSQDNPGGTRVDT